MVDSLLMRVVTSVYGQPGEYTPPVSSGTFYRLLQNGTDRRLTEAGDLRVTEAA